MFTNNKPGGRRRGPGRPRGRTREGDARREALYRVAIRLFAERGYEATTLRDIAARAEVSPALLYRYFPSKGAVVLALHEALSAEFAGRAAELPRGNWRTRFLAGLRLSLAVLGPHREALVALVPLLVSGQGEGVLSADTAGPRARVEGIFQEAVRGATDAPPDAHAAALGRMLYLAHLGVLLWWMLDRSRNQRATQLLLAFAERALAPIALALKLPATRRLLSELDRAAGLALLGEPAA